MAKERAGDRQPLLLAAGDLHSAFADDRVEALVGALEKIVRRGAMEHVEALGVGGVGANEQQVLADRAGEELRVLRHEADALAEAGRDRRGALSTPL